ncbi:jerky protein homolog-like [Homalodisca vitripennis]|uniref:jerky protein homolog-like n=1 Tax=Homalodisca vitripennis TaxID=197043 RepID=UPI001EEBBB85|nr:jerky protein homolog-like [Homalodisca vitripennis]
MDETGLNFKLLPRKTLATAKEKSAPGFKVSKERITVALCSNASGTHKLPLFVIGKSAKPRAFKTLDMSKLPVYYRSQKSAWMDSHLFKEWFICEFVPKVKSHLLSLKLPVSALLLLDNAPTHPDELTCEGETGIKLYFLPLNVTSLQQPMDQGVIECVKRKYRRKLLSEVLFKLENDEQTDLIQVLKTINVKDVIFMVAKAYDEVTALTITKSWRKVWPDIEKAFEKDGNNLVVPDLEHETEERVEILSDLMLLPHTEDIVEQDVLEWLTAEKELDNEVLNDEEIAHSV